MTCSDPMCMGTCFHFFQSIKQKTNLPSLKQTCSQNENGWLEYYTGTVIYCLFEFWPICRGRLLLVSGSVFVFFGPWLHLTSDETDKGLRLQDSRGESSRLWKGECLTPRHPKITSPVRKVLYSAYLFWGGVQKDQFSEGFFSDA